MNADNLLLLTEWFPTPDAPGREPFVADWARVVATFGSVTVVHGDEDHPAGALDGWQLETGIEVVRVGLTGSGISRPWQHVDDERRMAVVLRQLIREQRPGLINVHAYPAAVPLALVRHRPPVWLVEHYTRLLRDDMGVPQRAEARLAYRLCDEISVVGDVLTGPVARLSGRTPTVTGNPLNDAIRWSPPLEILDDAVRLLTVGRLEPPKGHSTLLAALALLPAKISLRIAGAGSLRGSLEERVRELGLVDRVTFLGQVPPSAVAREIQDAHVVVVPSVVETFSLVALEAIVTGRPVVSTPNGGPDAWMEPAWGRVTEGHRPEDLAAAIREEIAHLAARDSQSASRAARGRYSRRAVAGRVAPIVNRLRR